MKFDGIYEKTLVIIKPDAMQRGLIGDIITRFEKKGLKFDHVVQIKNPIQKKKYHGTLRLIGYFDQ